MKPPFPFQNSATLKSGHWNDFSLRQNGTKQTGALRAKVPLGPPVFKPAVPVQSKANAGPVPTPKLPGILNAKPTNSVNPGTRNMDIQAQAPRCWPPVYRPQRSPEIAQRKSSAAVATVPAGAPAIYRPTQKPLNAPPVFRPASNQRHAPARSEAYSPKPPIAFRPPVQTANKTITQRHGAYSRVNPMPPRAVQPKFSPDAEFRAHEEMVDALRLLEAAIDKTGNSRVKSLMDSALIDIIFTAGPMEGSKGHTTIEAPDPDNSEYWRNLATLARYHDLKGRKDLQITIAANTNLITQGKKKYYIIARTLAHELAAHVAPYTNLLKNIRSGLGLTPMEQDALIGGHGQGGGAGEHAAIARGESEYELLVSTLADLMPNVNDSYELALSYVQDVARYNPKTGGMLTEPKDVSRQFDSIAKHNWIQDIVKSRARKAEFDAIYQKDKIAFVTKAPPTYTSFPRIE